LKAEKYLGLIRVLVALFVRLTNQVHNEVRWLLGQEASLVPLCSNLRSFGSKCTV